MPSAYSPSLGGVEELTHRLARQLLEAGDDVEIWTHRYPSSLPRAEVVEGLCVRRLPFPLPAMRPGRLALFPGRALAALGELRSAVAEFRPDLLHVQCFSGNGIYAQAAAGRQRLPLVVSLQGETVMDDHDAYDRSATLRAGLRRGLRRADAVTACSGFVLSDAEERFGLEPGRGEVVPNGVDVPPREAPVPFAQPYERFVFAAGRLVHKKGFDLLVEAFAELTERHPEVGLVIGGDGPGRPRLEAAIVRCRAPDRILLAGRLSPAEVAWAMEAAAAFVLPSRVEPFGIVVLEALRAGAPVVVSSRGGATDIVRDGLDGLVVDPLDTAGLAEAVGRLLADPELARRLTQAGPIRASEFSWDRLGARYREIHARVAGASAAG